ncbi:sedoheptulose 7-phosphate cyclase [Amycolatopsis anabasis]|uniref:sedoheptulose 7-phosphate cyclase n=1 Tax=Amycolatopsis anabasis TaxID=1840409 RepID=UPI00131B2DBB|nr:sedoheptulose 7-phosphate cyclase [Amycolatopsis anabasis]
MFVVTHTEDPQPLRSAYPVPGYTSAGSKGVGVVLRPRDARSEIPEATAREFNCGISSGYVTRRDSRSWTLSAERRVGYDVVLTDRILDPVNPALAGAAAAGRSGEIRRFVVLDGNVDRLYGAAMRAYFAHHGIACEFLPLEVSEQRKTLEYVTRIVDALDEFGTERHDPIIAVGGGVLLDIAGLAASLYRRGTPYVRVPTTLIGLVDAGIGAKTGVNHGEHKNRLGSYHPPGSVLLDRAFLGTLDRRQLSNGLAEVLKMAIVADRRLFDLLEAHADLLLDERLRGVTETGDRVAREVLERAISGMLEELAGNLWETDLQRLVDFGHSISPLIEMRALPELLHGEAVALDMALFVEVSCHRGLVGVTNRDRMLRLIQKLGLPISHPLLEVSVLRRALADTTRHRGGMPRLPMPREIGSACFVNDISEDELVVAAKELRELEGDDGWSADRR